MTLLAGAAVLFFVVAAVFAMLGLGGAIVFVPLLHWLGFDLKTVAIPLGLALNGLNTLLALIPYSREGLVDWRGVWPMAVAVVLAAPLGALVVPFVARDLLLVLLALALLGAAGFTLLRSQVAEHARATLAVPRHFHTAGGGLGIGFCAGMLGVGGGFLVAPLLLGLGYTAKAAAASTAMVVTFSSFAGFGGHAAQCQFPVLFTVVAVLAVLAGSLVGARFLVRRANPLWLGKAYAALLVVIAVQLLWEGLA